MFRTSMVHPQERLQGICCEFGTYVVICVLLDTSGCYAVVGRTGLGAVHQVVRKLPHTYQIRNIQLVNVPEDGPSRSETCRATKCYE